jgi:hypothetical protein
MGPWVVAVAVAYETDQLTWRERPLADATPVAHQLLEPLLARAVARTNERTRCEGDDREVGFALAREIHRATSRPAYVLSRGLLRAPGYSRYTAAIERSDAERFGFDEREDVFGEQTLWQSWILTTAGPCSTYDIAGTRIGTDKIDHFFGLGWTYFREVHRGASEREAVANGTFTERSFYGLFTSKTFSFADLKANWDGYRYYAGLLGPDGDFERADDGCVAQARPFDWSRWIDAGWDEVLEPGNHTRLVERRLLRTLEERREEVCAARAIWDADGSREARLLALEANPDWVEGPAPLRRDPYQLAALCDATRTAPLVPHTRPSVQFRQYRREQQAP